MADQTTFERPTASQSLSGPFRRPFQLRTVRERAAVSRDARIRAFRTVCLSFACLEKSVAKGVAQRSISRTMAPPRTGPPRSCSSNGVSELGQGSRLRKVKGRRGRKAPHEASPFPGHRRHGNLVFNEYTSNGPIVSRRTGTEPVQNPCSERLTTVGQRLRLEPRQPVRPGRYLNLKGPP